MPRDVDVPQTGAPPREPREVAAGVLRLTAENPGPLTFSGTNSYLVGGATLAVIDPGPADPRHHAALLSAIAARPVTAVLLTHRHRDHAGGARALADAVGAPLLAAPLGPHHPARTPPPGMPPLPEPDRLLAGGDVIAGDGWSLAVIATPGHASDHLCFALEGQGVVFSGDHVMGWSTSSVVPPDGDMAAYIASLTRIAARPERLYLPGHGGAIADGLRRVALLRTHRRRREREVLARLRAGDAEVAAIAAAIYPGLGEPLLAAARGAVLAHLVDLTSRGLVTASPEAGPRARYTIPAG